MPGNLSQSALKNETAKQLNQSWMIPSVTFFTSRSTTDQIFTLQQIWEALEVCEKCLHKVHTFCRSQESVQPDSSRKALGNVHHVDSRLWLVKSLHACSDVYVRVGGVKSWPFTVGVGLRQGCVCCHHSSPQSTVYQGSQTQIAPRAKWGLMKWPEGRIMTLTQQWRYLNLTRSRFDILFLTNGITCYRQIISKRPYIRLKGTCSLAGRAFSNNNE